MKAVARRVSKISPIRLLSLAAIVVGLGMIAAAFHAAQAGWAAPSPWSEGHTSVTALIRHHAVLVFLAGVGTALGGLLMTTFGPSD